MQPAIPNTCDDEINRELSHDERTTSKDHTISGAGVRRWIDDAIDWLDRHWDDPELRTGFWRSGW